MEAPTKQEMLQICNDALVREIAEVKKLVRGLEGDNKRLLEENIALRRGKLSIGDIDRIISWVTSYECRSPAGIEFALKRILRLELGDGVAEQEPEQK